MITEDQDRRLLHGIRDVIMNLVREYVLIFLLPDPFDLLRWVIDPGDVVLPDARFPAGFPEGGVLGLLQVDDHGPLGFGSGPRLPRALGGPGACGGHHGEGSAQPQGRGRSFFQEFPARLAGRQS